jgi:uncharacterized damage-inducible protein DinB
MPQDQAGDTSVLTSLFRHNSWANLRLLDFCASLTEEQLSATAVGAHGSIRATLAHLVRAETDYVCRVTGDTPPPWMVEKRWPGFDGLKESARWSGEALARLALSARDGDLVRETLPEEGVAVAYPLSGLLVQAINHATEHREQISATITQLGLVPPDMTGWRVMEELGEFDERKIDPR